MMELYHTVNSVCAQKVRMVIAEKGLQYAERLMTLRGDQFEEGYRRLNPGAVVPTLVHDGAPVVESTVIMHYLDEIAPQPPLMPAAPAERARVRLYNKLVDEYVHNSCTALTFATAFRPRLAHMGRERLEASLAPAPNRKHAEYKLDVAERGMDSVYVVEALRVHDKLISWIEQSMQGGSYLAGAGYSLADYGVFPYVLRLDLLGLARMWDKRKGVAGWYERMRERPAVKKEVLDRMSEADWAPFRNIDPAPWPKAQAILASA